MKLYQNVQTITQRLISDIIKIYKKLYISPIIYIIILIRLLFLISFSPFLSYSLHITGDSITYYHLLVNLKSNLIHATGYPFLLGILTVPLRVFYHLLINLKSDLIHATGYPFLSGILTVPLRFILENRLVASSYVIVFIQHFISIIILTCFYNFLARKINKFIAHGFAIFYGLHYVVISSASMIYPEWLQANILLLLLLFLFKAFNQKNYKKKILLYLLVSVTLAFGFLVKYNFLFFLVFLIFIFVLDMLKTLKIRLLNLKKIMLLLLTCIISYSSVIWAYKIIYHKPSTGTYDLNYAHGWVLLYKLQHFNSILDMNAGINTRRLILLNSILPIVNKNIYAWRNINDVSPDIESYRQKYCYILNADNQTLDNFFKNNISQPNYLGTIFNIAYFLGMKEADVLGTRVFLEHVIKYPLKYINHIYKLSKNDLFHFKYMLIFPTVLDNSKFTKLRYGYYIHNFDHTIYASYYSVFNFYIWVPGVYFFSPLVKFFNLFSPFFITLFCFIGFIFSIINIIRTHSISFNNFVIISLSLLTFGYIIFSNAILSLRPEKEFILIFPIVILLVIFNLYEILNSLKPLIKNIQKKLPA